MSVSQILVAKDGTKMGKRIILEGEPGIGKSTLLSKLALDWARGTMPMPFSLVLFLEGKSIKSGDIVSHLHSNVLPENFKFSKENIKNLLDNPEIQEKTLILVDAFDEIRKGDERIGKLISGKEFSRCTVLVTSRPNYANTLFKYFDSSYVLPGYQLPMRQEFIHNYVRETGSSAETFTILEKSLFENDTISDLSRIPLYLSYLCMLVEDYQGALPESRTELYEDVVQLVIRKTSLRLGLDIHECYEAFKEICYIAFLSILVDRVQFEESDFNEVCSKPEIALQLGLLTQQMTKSRLNPIKTFSFSHKSLQEFLAAKFLRLRNDRERLQVLTKKQKDKRWNMVIVFLSGLLKGDNDALDMLYRQVICKDLIVSLQNISMLSANYSSHVQFHLGLQCLSESGIFDTFEELSEQIVPHCFLYSVPTCHYCLQGLVVALSRKPLHHKPELVIYGMDIGTYESFDYKLLEVMSACMFPPALVFANMVSVSALIEYLKKCCSARNDLEQLYIYMQPWLLPEPDGIREDDQELLMALSQLISLRSLVFDGSFCSALKGADVLAEELQIVLSMILANLGPFLQVLALKNHILSHTSADLLRKHITICALLTKVYLVDVHIEDTAFSMIMVRLAVLGTIKCLTLINCMVVTSEENRCMSLRSIEKVIHDNHLESFTFGYINLQGLEITPLLKAISSMSKLKSLRLEGPNVFSKDATLDILAAITCVTSLKKLELIQFGLTQYTVPMLCECIWELQNLEFLELCGNEIGNCRAFRQLCRVFNSVKSLKNLILEQCGITDKNLEFLTPLFHKVNLRVLSLMGNDICTTETVTKQLLGNISNSSSLRNLHIYFSKFSLPLAEMFAESLSGNRFLEELSISCRPTKDLIEKQSFQKAYRCFISKLPSLTSFRLGFADDPRINHAPRKSQHELWREICLDL